MSDIPKDGGPGVPRVPAAPGAGSAPFVTAGHAVLFEDNQDNACDVCARPLEDATARADEEEGDRRAVVGRGLLVWSRGEERRYQEPPLCAACATAIGVTALQRWEIEEEEG